jgi:hypothetical protein
LAAAGFALGLLRAAVVGLGAAAPFTFGVAAAVAGVAVGVSAVAVGVAVAVAVVAVAVAAVVVVAVVAPAGVAFATVLAVIVVVPSVFGPRETKNPTAAVETARSAIVSTMPVLRVGSSSSCALNPPACMSSSSCMARTR